MAKGISKVLKNKDIKSTKPKSAPSTKINKRVRGNYNYLSLTDPSIPNSEPTISYYDLF